MCKQADTRNAVPISGLSYVYCSLRNELTRGSELNSLYTCTLVQDRYFCRRNRMVQKLGHTKCEVVLTWKETILNA
jgi:hypothetical protein